MRPPAIYSTARAVLSSWLQSRDIFGDGIMPINHHKPLSAILTWFFTEPPRNLSYQGSATQWLKGGNTGLGVCAKGGVEAWASAVAPLHSPPDAQRGSS